MQTRNHTIIVRLAADAGILACIFIAPFWLTATLALVGAFFFTRYYEIIAFGILVDALYAPSFSGAIFAQMTLFAVVLYACVQFAKPRLRFFA